MRSPDSGRSTEDTFVATIRGRLQHEFHEPGQRDLRLLTIVDDLEHNPTLVAIGAGQLPLAEDSFVGVFSIDRATFDDAVVSDRDPIEAGELVSSWPKQWPI